MEATPRMKTLAVVLVAIGLVWTLQGLGVLGGSFMTGQGEWLYIGIVVAVAGAALFVWTVRRRPIGRTGASPPR